MNKLILLAVLITLTACSNNKDKENDLLKDQISKMESQIKTLQEEKRELQNTPSQRLLKAKKYVSTGDQKNALSEFKEIVNKYPGTEEFLFSIKEIKRIEKEIEQARKAEEDRKAMGFKVFKSKTKVDLGNLAINFNSVTKAKEWIFDDYGSSYHYRAAERGNTHIVCKVSISSKDKNPSLPGLCAYKLEKGELKYVGSFTYKFKKWEDYGSYLGNYSDYKNDFSHTETISFNCGLQLDEKFVGNNTLYIVLSKNKCVVREHNKYSRPEVSYNDINCDFKNTISVEDFEKNYELIKIM